MNQPDEAAVRAAETYESFLVPALFEPWARVLIDRSGIRSGERVLDLACGTGIVARHAAAIVAPAGVVAALDANPAMIHVGRKRLEAQNITLDWRQGDALALPYPDGSFDAVLCQQGLQFFPDQVAALKEMRRVLAPGGRVAIAVWRSLDHNPVYKELNEAIRRRSGVPALAVPFSLGDPDRLRRLMGEAGFENIEIRPEVQYVRFRSSEDFVRLSVNAAAAAVPAFAAMDEAARAALAEGVRSDVEPMLRAHLDGTDLVEETAAHIATGYR